MGVVYPAEVEKKKKELMERCERLMAVMSGSPTYDPRDVESSAETMVFVDAEALRVAVDDFDTVLRSIVRTLGKKK